MHSNPITNLDNLLAYTYLPYLPCLRSTLRTFGMIFFASFLSSIATAADFYIDPIHGKNTNNGSITAPWKDLNYLFNNGIIKSQNWDLSGGWNNQKTLQPRNVNGTVNAGDTLYLMTGNYGELNIKGYYNESNITIAAASGQTPRFTTIEIVSAKNWVFDGVYINWQSDGATEKPGKASFNVSDHSWSGPASYITLKNSTIKSAESISGWTRTEWLKYARSGIDINFSEYVTIENTLLENTAHAITLRSPNSTLKNNSIVNYGLDGIRIITAHNAIIENNLIKNSFLMVPYGFSDEWPNNGTNWINHNDAIQHWAENEDTHRVDQNAVTRNVIIRNNVIISYEDSTLPLLSKNYLQAIGSFDGQLSGWIIEKNIISIDHTHGISLFGASDTVVQSNLLTNPTGGYTSINIKPNTKPTSSGNPAIPSYDVTVTCNITPNIQLVELNSTDNLVEYSNTKTSEIAGNWKNVSNSYWPAECNNHPSYYLNGRMPGANHSRSSSSAKSSSSSPASSSTSSSSSYSSSSAISSSASSHSPSSSSSVVSASSSSQPTAISSSSETSTASSSSSEAIASSSAISVSEPNAPTTNAIAAEPTSTNTKGKSGGGALHGGTLLLMMLISYFANRNRRINSHIKRKVDNRN